MNEHPPTIRDLCAIPLLVTGLIIGIIVTWAALTWS